MGSVAEKEQDIISKSSYIIESSAQRKIFFFIFLFLYLFLNAIIHKTMPFHLGSANIYMHLTQRVYKSHLNSYEVEHIDLHVLHGIYKSVRVFYVGCICLFVELSKNLRHVQNQRSHILAEAKLKNMIMCALFLFKFLHQLPSSGRLILQSLIGR